MSVITKTEGIIIKREYFRDTSKIVTIFSKDYGKLELLAKGAFDPKRNLGGSLEPFTFSEVIFYYREGREYYLLANATLLYDFRILREEPERFYFASLLAEFILNCLPKEVPQTSLYQLFLSTFYRLTKEGKENLIYSFLIKAATLLGYKPNFITCVKCHKRPDRFFFAVARGGFLCEACRAGEVINFEPSEVEGLKNLLFLPQTKIGKIELGEKEKNVVRQFLAHHLNFHLFPNPFASV